VYSTKKYKIVADDEGYYCLNNMQKRKSSRYLFLWVNKTIALYFHVNLFVWLLVFLLLS